MALHSEAKLDKKFTEFAKLMNVYLNHFPRHEKYALAQDIRRTAYDVYGHIVEAQKRYHKKTTLTNLDIKHEQLRMFLRLAFELGYFQFRDGKTSDVQPERLAENRYMTISLMVDELGRMIGGWMAVEHGPDKRETS